jgi:hypothetical protein
MLSYLKPRDEFIQMEIQERVNLTHVGPGTFGRRGMTKYLNRKHRPWTDGRLGFRVI